MKSTLAFGRSMLSRPFQKKRQNPRTTPDVKQVSAIVESLPVELLEQIFLYLRWQYETTPSGRGGLAALCAACRTSRKFLRIAQPVLYHTVIAWKLSPSLVRTLFEEPHLARLVRDLRIGSPAVGSAQTKLINRYARLIARRLGLTPSLEACVLNMLESNRSDAQMALVLTLTPNVERVTITSRSRDGIPAIFNSPASLALESTSSWTSELPVVQHLYKARSISLLFDHVYCGKIRQRMALLMLPNIETVNVSGADFRGFINDVEARQCKLKLQHVNIDLSYINSSDLENLLLMCPHLQSLVVRWLADDDGGSVHLDLTRVGDALRSYARSLEILDLNVERPDLGSNATRQWTLGALGSLIELGKLRTLNVVRTVLVGEEQNVPCPLREYIPSSLEEFTLHDTQEFSLGLEELSDMIRDERLRNLRAVHIKLWSADEQVRGLSCAEDISGVFESLGWDVEGEHMLQLSKKR
ncbi:hypothetical protein BX600DRAFT_467690 [Xylariales sp. PMI_506]|nr:hypothetical protein BX600DRAFT_467690 [Xylariales sp. PMI_506]